MNADTGRHDSDSGAQEAEAPRQAHPGRLTFYHADAKGTGAAARLELRLNRRDEDRYDCFFLEMANQQTAARTEQGRRVATFDWDHKATVKLDFGDVCEFLTVLEGKSDHAGGSRNGLYHQSGATNTLIGFRKDPARSGYFLDISRKDAQGSQVFKGYIVLSEAEALGLRCVLQTGLFHLTFHASLREG